MNAWDFLSQFPVSSRERNGTGRASRSEVKRWLQNGAVMANGERLEWDEPMDFPIFSLVLFHKSHGRVTLW